MLNWYLIEDEIEQINVYNINGQVIESIVGDQLKFGQHNLSHLPKSIYIAEYLLVNGNKGQLKLQP